MRVLAYGFSSSPILSALVAAHARGVDVAVVLDRSNARPGRYGAATIAEAGIPVWIDTEPGIAHDKVMVIDGARVITGSFNYTGAADRRNAENVVVLQGGEVAAWFGAEWERRRAVSRAWER